MTACMVFEWVDIVIREDNDANAQRGIQLGLHEPIVPGSNTPAEGLEGLMMAHCRGALSIARHSRVNTNNDK